MSGVKRLCCGNDGQDTLTAAYNVSNWHLYYGQPAYVQTKPVNGSWSAASPPIDPASLVYVALSPTGTTHLIAGTWDSGFHYERSASASSLTLVETLGFSGEMQFDPAGNLYVLDNYNTLHKRDANGMWSTKILLTAPNVHFRSLAIDASGRLHAIGQPIGTTAEFRHARVCPW